MFNKFIIDTKKYIYRRKNYLQTIYKQKVENLNLDIRDRIQDTRYKYNEHIAAQK